MACKNICKLCRKLVLSESVTFSGGQLVIRIPSGSYSDGEKICLVVAQSIPTDTTVAANVVIQIGDGAVLYPVTKCNCAPLTACGVRTRTKYSMVIRTTVDTGTFRLLGNVPCCPDNLRAINGEGTPVTPTTAPEAGA